MTQPGLPFENAAAHPQRDAVLGEVHARPFQSLEPPCRLFHYAFLTDSAAAKADLHALTAFCLAQGVAEPAPQAKHHRINLAGANLRWEQHSEFTTYTIAVVASATEPFQPARETISTLFAGLAPPGPQLAAVDLHLLPGDVPVALETIFEARSLAASNPLNGAARVATDFRVNADGFVRILVANRALDAISTGALVLRLLEIETYRTLALLGLPTAQRLAPSIGAAEVELAQISHAMSAAEGLDTDNQLLERLTALAAKSEAESTEAAFRFGASRAYNGIVQQRLSAIAEEPRGLTPTLSAFLSRRMQPAMRTCEMLQERQADLSRKLTRAANLLRTRVDVEIERQNRDLLHAMNERSRVQLRLQQTVEGLSVAAISYYVVGLAGYIFKALKEMHLLPIDPAIATAASVPVAVLAIALVVRRIRNSHSGH